MLQLEGNNSVAFLSTRSLAAARKVVSFGGCSSSALHAHSQSLPGGSLLHLQARASQTSGTICPDFDS